MAEIIDLPQLGSGTPEQQLEVLYSYLYRLATDLNINFEQIGYNGLTDSERELMHDLTRAEMTPQQKAAEELYSGIHNYAEAETLKSLIIKTAQFVKDEVENMRVVLFGEESASGQFGDWKRRKGLRVDVTPDGVKQTYSYAEIVQGLKTYEINAKNYIKTGYLRTENMLPVYGVAIGKDVVTFAEDGTETYNDGNKVAELTADELSFYQGTYKVASYTGTDVIFYQGGVERVRINADGVVFKNGTTKLAEILNTALKFYYNGTLRSQMDNDGISFYDGITKLAELTGNALNFYQGGNLAAKLQGSKLEFYNSGTLIFSIENGKIYTHENMEIGAGKNITIGDWIIDNDGLRNTQDASTPLHPDATKTYGIRIGNNAMELYYYIANTGVANGFNIIIEEGTATYGPSIADDSCIRPDSSGTGTLGSTNYRWRELWVDYIICDNPIINSSLEVKHNIMELPDIGEKLDKLTPVTFAYNRDPTERRRTGLIHEETIQVLPEICYGAVDDPPEKKAINYVELIPMLLKEIQSLRARVKALEEKGD